MKLKFQNSANIDRYIYNLFNESRLNKKSNYLFSGGESINALLYEIKQNNPDLRKISITLSDERLVGISSDLSNAKMYVKKLLPYLDFKPNFYLLPKNFQISTPETLLNDIIQSQKNNFSFDISFLGVGYDGHIASIFDKHKILAKKYPLMVIKNRNEKFSRISFCYDALKKIPKTVLIIKGRKKIDILKKIVEEKHKDTIVQKFISDYEGKLTIVTDIKT